MHPYFFIWNLSTCLNCGVHCLNEFRRQRLFEMASHGRGNSHRGKGDRRAGGSARKREQFVQRGRIAPADRAVVFRDSNRDERHAPAVSDAAQARDVVRYSDPGDGHSGLLAGSHSGLAAATLRGIGSGRFTVHSVHRDPVRHGRFLDRRVDRCRNRTRFGRHCPTFPRLRTGTAIIIA
jgi:hypothetical protein